MGWYKHLKNATKGAKKASKDIGRVLSGDETKKALDNMMEAADIVAEVVAITEGGATAVSVAQKTGDPVKKKDKNKKEKE